MINGIIMEKMLRKGMKNYGEGVLKDGDTQFIPLSAIQRKCEDTVLMQNLFGVLAKHIRSVLVNWGY